MNDNHLKLAKKLIPLVWKPGFMGSFMGRFLLDDEIINKTKNNKRQFLTDSYEWFFHDRLATYFGLNDVTKNLSDFKKYTNYIGKKYKGIDLHLATMYLVAKLTQDDYNNHRLALNEITVSWDTLPNMSNERIDSLVNSAFDYSNFYFPYIKTHINGNINIINFLEPEKKMYCDFPKEKSWIPALLHFYKLYICKKKYDDQGMPTEGTLQQYNIFTSIISSKYHWDLNYVVDPISIKDYTKIDMYDLIFNKNISQLSTIDNKFSNPISPSRLELLDLVEHHIEYICHDYFGIPTSYNIDVSSDVIDDKLLEIYKQHLIK